MRTGIILFLANVVCVPVGLHEGLPILAALNAFTAGLVLATLTFKKRRAA